MACYFASKKYKKNIVVDIISCHLCNHSFEASVKLIFNHSATLTSTYRITTPLQFLISCSKWLFKMLQRNEIHLGNLSRTSFQFAALIQTWYTWKTNRKGVIIDPTCRTTLILWAKYQLKAADWVQWACRHHMSIHQQVSVNKE